MTRPVLAAAPMVKITAKIPKSVGKGISSDKKDFNVWDGLPSSELLLSDEVEVNGKRKGDNVDEEDEGSEDSSDDEEDSEEVSFADEGGLKFFMTISTT